MAQGPRRTLSKWGSLRPIMLPTWARAELHLAWRSDTEIPALASMQKIARARLARPGCGSTQPPRTRKAVAPVLLDRFVEFGELKREFSPRT
jgi:hypothetical protein